MKQLVLVVDSIYGPGGASVQMLFTEETDLIKLIVEMDEMRSAASIRLGEALDEKQRPEAWSEKEILKWFDENKVDIIDGTDVLLGNNIKPTFVKRTHGWERKWLAIGLGNSINELPNYFLLSDQPQELEDIYQWHDYISFQGDWRSNVNDLVTNHIKMVMEKVPVSEWQTWDSQPESEIRYGALIFPLVSYLEHAVTIGLDGSITLRW